MEYFFYQNKIILELCCCLFLVSIRILLVLVGIESCVICNVTPDITISFLPLSLSLIPLLFVQEFGKHILQCGMGWDQLLLAYVGIRIYDLSPLHNMKHIWVFKLVQYSHKLQRCILENNLKKKKIKHRKSPFTFSTNAIPYLLRLVLLILIK